MITQLFLLVYLKTKGIDPKTHSVFRELVRYSIRPFNLLRLVQMLKNHRNA